MSLHTLVATVTDSRGQVATSTQTVTVTVPVSGKVVIGTSAYGGVPATAKVFTNAKAFRIYQGGDPVPYSAEAQTVPAGAEVWDSAKPSMQVLSDKTNPAYAATMAKVKAWYDSYKRPAQLTVQHEIDNPSKLPAGMTIPQWQAEYVASWNNILDVCVGNPNVTWTTILMGFVLTASHPHGDPEGWYVARAPRIGFDCYSLSVIPLIVAYAKAKGKPYSIPEFGGGGPNDSQPGDAGGLAFAKGTVAAWQSYPPYGACWFSSQVGTGQSDMLANLPQTTAYLVSIA